MSKPVIRQLSPFTKRLKQLNNEPQFLKVAARLQEHPELGDVIPGAGGLRKIRVALPGMGKRGGGRIIYLWLKEMNTLVFFWQYAKGESENISPEGKKALAAIAAQVKIEYQSTKGKKG